MSTSLTPRAARRSMRLLILGVFLWCGYGAMQAGSLFTGMLLSIGLDKVQIGWIMSLGLLLLPFQTAGALLQQQFFHRKRFWMSLLILNYAVFFGIAYLLHAWGGINHWSAVFLFFVLFIVGRCATNMHGPVVMSWQGEIIPSGESNSFWGRHTVTAMIGSMIAGIIMGHAADVLGRDSNQTYALLLGIGTCFGVVSTLLTAQVPDPAPAPRPIASLGSLFRETLSNKTFLRLTGFFSYQSFMTWFSAGFIFVYLQQNMNFSQMTLQILGAFSVLMSFLFSKVFRILAGKYGRKPILVICSLLKMVEFVLWGTLEAGDNVVDRVGGELINSTLAVFGFGPVSFPEGFLHTVPVFLLCGIVNFGLVSTQTALISSTGNKRTLSLSISLFSSITGICGALSAGVSGALYEYLGTLPQLAQWHLTPFNILALVGAFGYGSSVLILRGMHEYGALPTGVVVRNLISQNPLRSLYMAHVLSQPMHEENRAELLRHAQSDLVTGDLVRDLYSTSARVRESAIVSLRSYSGKNSSELERALLRLIDEPEFGLADQAVRALGNLKSVRAVPRLLRILDAPENRLTAGALFAAGLIADRRFEPSLRRILSDLKHPEHHAAAADALSRTGDSTAAAAIYRAYAGESNRILQLQCLEALCRTMSRSRGRVHTVFESELLAAGSQIELRLKNIIASRHWRENGISAPVFERLIGLFEENRYAELLSVLLCDEFALCGFENFGKTSDPGVMLGSCIVGEAPHAAFQAETEAARNLGMQLRLLAMLYYDGNEPDRMRLLSALLLAESLLKSDEIYR